MGVFCLDEKQQRAGSLTYAERQHLAPAEPLLFYKLFPRGSTNQVHFSTISLLYEV